RPAFGLAIEGISHADIAAWQRLFALVAILTLKNHNFAWHQVATVPFKFLHIGYCYLGRLRPPVLVGLACEMTNVDNTQPAARLGNRDLFGCHIARASGAIFPFVFRQPLLHFGGVSATVELGSG